MCRKFLQFCSNFSLNILLCRIFSNILYHCMVQRKFSYFSFYLIYNILWQKILIILILLFTFINFELSGQNVHSFCKILRNWIFDKYWNILFIYLLNIVTYCQYMRKYNKPVLPGNQDKYLTKKTLIWLVWGNSFTIQLFRTLYTISEWKKFQVKILPSNIFKFAVAPPILVERWCTWPLEHGYGPEVYPVNICFHNL